MASSPTKIKVPQIARWRIAGVSEVKIADLLGVTVQSIRQIVQSQEYVDEETSLLNAHLSAMDEALAGKVDVIRQNFRAAVPAAMRCLVDAVTQRKDLKSAMAAAKEILDRDPDRTLTTVQPRAEEDATQKQVPDEVLAQAVAESNEIHKALNGQDKKGVN